MVQNKLETNIFHHHHIHIQCIPSIRKELTHVYILYKIGV